MEVRRLAHAASVVHPFPSATNGVLVTALAALAGGGIARAVVLGVAMMCLHFAIGAVNDLFDEDADRVAKPHKPIPSGALSRRAAAAAAGVAAGVGSGLSAIFGAGVFALALITLGAGLAYDAFLKRTPMGWLPYSVAFACLPLYAWFGAVGAPPPRWELLLPVAALAGPTLAVANGIADIERDLDTGVAGFAVALGRGRATKLNVCLQAVILAIAWASSLAAGSGPPVIAALGAASALSVAGLRLTSSASRVRRQRGWEVQAVGLAALGAAWLLGAVVAAA